MSPLLATYRLSSPLISTKNGQSFDENTDGPALLTAVIEDILKRPLRLEKVIDGCLSIADGQSQCNVVSLGPNSAEDMIVKALETNASTKIFTHDHLHANIPAGLTAFGDAPRTSKRPKLAIVGMAGRFPNAADHEKFWDLLEAGLDVHKKVMHKPSNFFGANVLISHGRFLMTGSMSKATMTPPERYAIQVIPLSVALLMSLVFSIPDSSTCHHARQHKQIRCIDWVCQVPMKL